MMMKNNIRNLRKDKGLRQEDLAQILGVTRQTIIAIENDKYNPTLELAMKLARFLESSVEDIFILED
jgi:putative transcriptional regulator